MTVHSRCYKPVSVLLLESTSSDVSEVACFTMELLLRRHSWAGSLHLAKVAGLRFGNCLTPTDHQDLAVGRGGRDYRGGEFNRLLAAVEMDDVEIESLRVS